LGGPVQNLFPPKSDGGSFRVGGGVLDSRPGGFLGGKNGARPGPRRISWGQTGLDQWSFGGGPGPTNGAPRSKEIKGGFLLRPKRLRGERGFRGDTISRRGAGRVTGAGKGWGGHGHHRDSRDMVEVGGKVGGRLARYGPGPRETQGGDGGGRLGRRGWMGGARKKKPRVGFTGPRPGVPPTWGKRGTRRGTTHAGRRGQDERK